MSQEQEKQAAAKAAVERVPDNAILGVGTGSTTEYFITALVPLKARIEATVASSERTREALKKHGFPVVDANSVAALDLYVDGADEATLARALIKGGGGALTGEKILAAMAKEFIVMIDSSKRVSRLGEFPLPVEVIPLARSFVARELVKLGGDPVWRPDFVTDYGHVILDVYNLSIDQPAVWEQKLNQIPGVVTNGLFALRPADQLIVGTETGVEYV